MAVEDLPTQSTQQSTQSTQEDSQERAPGADVNLNLWGSLIPFNPANPHIHRIDFLKTKKKYTIGRSRKKDTNDVSFPHFMKMSHTHCAIEWDGECTADSAVVVTDLMSSNGTYINGKRIGKGECRLLRDCNIISFGDRPKDKPREDYRFIFQHMAHGQTQSEGLYKYYDVQHVLGRGAFATVVKAVHRTERKWYAVKMFPGDKLQQLLSNSPSRNTVESTVKHLKREIAILKMLRHRNICQIKEEFFEGYNISIVLEFVPGGDLMAYMLKREVLLEVEAQNITYQICDALAHVHSLGVVHRDLKPENVLLTKDSPPIVKVADFGLAKIIDSISMLQTKCGTPAFVAPEVLNQGPNGYDKAVDSWSLGVMVFMMVTKCNPFHNESTLEADWDLLRDYNITEDGERFLRSLLDYHPHLRMTPDHARDHVWLHTAKHRLRRIERERSLRSVSSATQTFIKMKAKYRATPPNPAEPTPVAGPSRGTKRKAGVLELNRSLSSLSVQDQQPAPKKARCDSERKDVSVSSSVATAREQPDGPVLWPVYNPDVDEIPGLGQLRNV